jgi:hypothetical protein
LARIQEIIGELHGQIDRKKVLQALNSHFTLTLATPLNDHTLFTAQNRSRKTV